MSPERERRERAVQLLRSSAVTVLEAQPGRVVATVRASSGQWSVRYADGTWSCSCPRLGSCSHLTAVGFVTNPTLPGPFDRRPRLTKLDDHVFVELDDNGNPVSSVDAARVAEAGGRLAWTLLTGAVMPSGRTQVHQRWTRFLKSADGLQGAGAVAMAALTDVIQNLVLPAIEQGLLPSPWVWQKARERGAL